MCLLFFFSSFLLPKVVDINSIEEGWMGLDIGPKTLSDIQAGLADCKTVIWNGPMGKQTSPCTYDFHKHQTFYNCYSSTCKYWTLFYFIW